MGDKNKRQFSQDSLSDLSMLDSVSESRILSVLKTRYLKHDDIYTNIGPVLIAINPYKTMKALYTEAKIREYRGKKYFEMPPHPYALIDDAYNNMITYHENQCVIICGESGSGKTESAKIMLNYISSVTGKGTGVQLVKDRMLSSNPILEGFGNAKTINNDNSSRFGKYMVLHFDYGGEPIGGSVQQYLLEKSRVVGPAINERNFHVFYQICNGLSPDLKKTFMVEDVSYFRYLASSQCFQVPGINDAADWKEMVEAMEIIGLSEQERSEIVRTLAVILWLGNVDFNEGADESSAPADKDVIAIIAHLLQVTPDVVVNGLCVRTITARNESIKKPCCRKDAEFNRDTLAKAMYSKLFDYLVDRINRSILPPQVEHCVIGILDIFGFEIFDFNSFEQLCINFVNEKLQQIFIELTLKTEQEEYTNEGIPWNPIPYYDNKPVCDLIEGRPGILSVLDDTCATNKNEIAFVQQMGQLFARHDRLQCGETDFTVEHYAGKVHYDSAGFTIKNKDTLFDDLVIVLQQSPCPFVQAHGWNLIDTTAQQKARPPTVGRVFRDQVRSLMSALMSCVPHYVRCIKPNHQKTPNNFDERVIQRQVQYLGLLENVRVRRAGYAYRATFERFAKRYGVISEEVVTTHKHLDDRSKVLKLAQYLGWVENNQYAMGKTKIFVREAAVLFNLEEMLERKIGSAVTVIQTAYRFYLQKRRFMEMKASGYDALKMVNKERRRLSVSGNIDYRGDYINIRTCLPAQMLIQQSGVKEDVLFADRGFYVNVREKKGLFGSLFGAKEQETESRNFIVTNAAIYCYKLVYCAPEKQPEAERGNYNANGICAKLFWRATYDQIRVINMSSYTDGYMVFHFHDHAGIRSQVVNIPRKTEFFAAVYYTLDQNDKKPNLAAVTEDRVLVNAKKQTYVTISWVKDETVTADMPVLSKHKKEKQNFIITVASGTPFASVPEPYRPPKVDYKSGGRVALKATRNVQGNGVDELAFNAGDILYVVRDLEKGWYQCELNGNIGWVEENAVERITKGPTPGLAPPRQGGHGVGMMGAHNQQQRPGMPPAPAANHRPGLPPPPSGATAQQQSNWQTHQQPAGGRPLPPVPGGGGAAPGGRPLPPVPGGGGAPPAPGGGMYGRPPAPAGGMYGGAPPARNW